MTSRSLKDLAIGFLTTVVAGDVEGAYDRYVGAGFLHHNPCFPGGAASLRTGMADDARRNGAGGEDGRQVEWNRQARGAG